MNEYPLDSLDTMTDMMPGFSVREDFGHTIIKAIGEIDAYNAPSLTATIRKQIRDGHHRLIVDLTSVPFMDSSGLGALVGGYKRTKVHPDGRFAVVCSAKRFLDALRITGLVRVLPVYDTLGHVVQALDLDGESHSSMWHHHSGRHAVMVTSVPPQTATPIPTPTPTATPATVQAAAEAAVTTTSCPKLACDRTTLLHLAELGDIDALVERSLLFG